MTNERTTLAINGGDPITTLDFPANGIGPAEIGEEEIEAVVAAMRTRKLFRFDTPGPSRCAELEDKFKAMTGCNHALAVGGGTAALICGLIGMGVGEGDEVIVPAHTYIASASAVLICGGVPVICEIDETLTMDPGDIERNITSRTKAIMPVHMRGVPCDMDRIMAIAKKHNLDVIEDAAQACGGSYKGKMLGSFGRVGCFSLQQYKIMTAGEGGMIVTDEPEIFQRAAIRHDSAMCYWRPGETSVQAFPGENFRMNEMEGALGCVQFGRMSGLIAQMRDIQSRIKTGIQDLQGFRQHESPCPEGECGLHVTMFMDSGEAAKQFSAALKAEGLPAASLYDKGIPDRHIYCYWEYVMEKLSPHKSGWPWTSPLHDQSRSYSPDMCPHTLNILARTVLIPIFHNYKEAHVDAIIEGIRKVAGSGLCA